MTKVPIALRRVQPQIAHALRFLTRIIGPFTRRLSPLLGVRGVPRTTHRSTHGWIAQHRHQQAVLDVVRTAEHLKREVPDGVPPDHHSFVDDTEFDLPEGFVLALPNGRVLGELGAVITPDNGLLFDVSPYFAIEDPRHHPIFRRLRLPVAETFEGTLGVVATRGDANFYHFMLDALPRLSTLEDAGALADLDGIAARHDRPFHQQLLALCGVSAERIVDTSVHRHLRARRLLVPSIPALHSQTPRWVVEFLRRRLMPPDPLPGDRPTRFYVSRGGGHRTRAVTNEAAVSETLSTRSIVAVSLERMSMTEQIELFRGAELIVAPHGAGLTNVVFCGPRARVVEIFSPRYVNPCFWKLACQVEGLEYAYVVGSGPAPPPERALEGVSEDITVDIERLNRVVDRATR